MQGLRSFATIELIPWQIQEFQNKFLKYCENRNRKKKKENRNRQFVDPVLTEEYPCVIKKQETGIVLDLGLTSSLSDYQKWQDAILISSSFSHDMVTRSKPLVFKIFLNKSF